MPRTALKSVVSLRVIPMSASPLATSLRRSSVPATEMVARIFNFSSISLDRATPSILPAEPGSGTEMVIVEGHDLSGAQSAGGGSNIINDRIQKKHLSNNNF